MVGEIICQYGLQVTRQKRLFIFLNHPNSAFDARGLI